MKTSASTKHPPMSLILTHDVDWPLHGPGTAHVLARKDRFAPEIIRKVQDEGFNPYYGVPKVMEIEEQFGVRSTFLFRPRYDDGSEVGDYKQTMRELISGGWEIGLHCNKTSTVEEVRGEKQLVESAAGQTVFGTRIHYLNVGENTFGNLAAAGIKYDSSLSFNKSAVDVRNTGYLFKSGLTVFPLTFMDAYLFTYTHLTEETIVPFITKSLETLAAAGVRLATLLWHDNAVMMKGGRAYAELIKQLTALPNIAFLRGIDAFEMVQKQQIQNHR